jgi:diguanylate cyclase (GGDEF)-like protein
MRAVFLLVYPYWGRMNASLINILIMQLVTAVLTVIMLIAWRTFDRPRHAFMWALAFGIGTLAWLIVVVAQQFDLYKSTLYAFAAGLGCLCRVLLAAGFVQRARGRVETRRFLRAAGAALVLVAVVTLAISHQGTRDVVWFLFGAVMLVISAAHVSRSIRTASLAERATTFMLLLFAVADFGAAVAAIGFRADGHGSGFQFFRFVVLILHPPAFIGVGLFAVFLVAADVAERMRALAVSDLLTGIANRRGFEEAAERAIRNAQRQGQPLTLVVTDIDRFKAINDRHGHVAGDRAIQHFAKRMERMVRRGDLIGRIGGEEFALMLINTRSVDAVEVVERLRRDVGAMPVDGPDAIRMTASFGMTDLRPGDTTLANLFARADRALYRAKIDGRDRVACAEMMEDPLLPQDKAWAASNPA